MTNPIPGPDLSHKSMHNVANYGAMGDGVTDDAVAVQAAINAAEADGGGVVVFPFAPSGYLLGTPVVIADPDVLLTGESIPPNIEGGAPRRLGGHGSPEGIYTAPAGSSYLSADGVSYTKGTSTGNTGWSVVTTYDGVYNVKSYGAVGDGVTDDTAAIQAAVDAAGAAGGGEVYFSTGDYVVTSSLTVSSPNISLLGAGAASRVLSGPAAGLITLAISGANTSVSHLEFVGSVSSEVAPQNECIALQAGAINPKISQCTFTGVAASSGYNVHIRGHLGVVNPTISGNHMDHIVGTNSGYGYSVQLADVVGGEVSHNVIHQTAVNGRHHIYISANSTGVLIQGNHLFGGTGAMITLYATSATPALSGAIISGNFLDAEGSGGGSGGCIEAVWNTNLCSIRGNTVLNAATYGVKAEGMAAELSSCLYNSVKGNIITASGSSAVYILGAMHTSVLSNTIVDSNAAAILIRDTGLSLCDGSTFYDNTVVGTTHTYALDANGTNIHVSGNFFAIGSMATFANLFPNTRKVAVDNFTSDYPMDTVGAGSPEGTITAPVGSTYHRTDGSIGTTLYTKASGTGNTGWVPVSSSTTPYMAKTAPYTLTPADSGKVISNVGATGPLGLTLPTATVGLHYNILRSAAFNIRLTPPAGVTIQVGATTLAPGAFLDTLAQGSYHIMATSPTTWVVLDHDNL